MRSFAGSLLISGIVRVLGVFYSRGMESATLRVGDPAPPFELPIANGEGTLSLAQLVERGPAIVEFVRGVW